MYYRSQTVANMTSYANSSSLILVIHDNMIIGTNHIVLACLLDTSRSQECKKTTCKNEKIKGQNRTRKERKKWKIRWRLERGEWVGAGKILLKEPGLYPRQIPVTHERWIESHTNRQHNKVMDQPQVLGTIPWSTRGSTKERREESNQETKQPGSGGPSSQEGRTVRTSQADRPPRYRGLSAQVRRTVQPGARIVR
jgi:hypothetical protein